MGVFRVRRAAPIVLALLAGCHGEETSLSADHAWVRLAAVSGRPAAAYFVVHGGPTPTRLIAVDSTAAGSSELHSMTTEGGMMSMRRIDGLDVPANGDARFAPGGNHVMLFGMSGVVKPGDTLPLTLRFSRGDPLIVKAKVVAAGSDAPY